MATANHTQGCAAKTVPPASIFLDNTPTKADTDQWCQVENAYLLRHIRLKLIVLPRQARDRHRGRALKTNAVSHRRSRRLAESTRQWW